MESREDYINTNYAEYEGRAEYIEHVRQTYGDTRKGIQAIKRRSKELYWIVMAANTFLAIFAISAFVKMSKLEIIHATIIVVIVILILLACKLLGLVFLF